MTKYHLENVKLWRDTKVGLVRVRIYKFRIPELAVPDGYLAFESGPIVGVDPGVTTALSVFRFTDTQYVIELKMPPKKKLGRVDRMLQWLNLIQADYDVMPLPGLGTAYIEDAAFYGRPKGQVALAENRTSVALGLMERGLKVELVNPMTARKGAFGSAKISPKKLWDDSGLSGDCRDAIGMALYGLNQREVNYDG
jgi:hypothetical protein